MLIEQVFPEAVQELSDMKSCIISKLKNAKQEDVDSFISSFPSDLLVAKCFFVS